MKNVVNHFVENDLLEAEKIDSVTVATGGAAGGWRLQVVVVVVGVLTVLYPAVRSDRARVRRLLPHQHRPDVKELLEEERQIEKKNVNVKEGGKNQNQKPR